jgi:antitoxin component YwqK of YwqJK toxin-antitoxin module
MTRFSKRCKWTLAACVAFAAGAANVVADDVLTPVESSRRSIVVKAVPSTTPTEATTAAPDAAPITPDESLTELIRERYPNGKVRIERGVTQDDQGNYVNHGPWKMWDVQGTLIADGQFRIGQRHGPWNRWYRVGEVSLFNEAPYNQFQGPFISQATFENGRLHGIWTIFDSKQQKISEIEYADGVRNGMATWWYANGRKMQEFVYREGAIDGELLQWDANAKLIVRDTYQTGRKLAAKVNYHTGGQKKSEGLYLYAQLIVESADDWWSAKPAVYTQQGKDERHGPWIAWHPNGQIQLEGKFHRDAEVGRFTWWYANGQRALEGQYDDGKQTGTWTWWHENGQKKIEGDFQDGHPTGAWMWWQTDGKVAQKADFSHTPAQTVTGDKSPKTPREAMLQQPERLQLELR